MSYLHIENLYKNQDILLFKECYAMEKIHGSSAHVAFNITNNEQKYDLHFFSGGESHERFVSIFNKKLLFEKFKEIGQDKIIVYGEVYGGKCQGMSATYGKELKFVAFDVKIGHCWLDVLKAEQIVLSLGLEFVDYVKINTDLISIDLQRDKHSIQAIRNGMGEGKLREGVVLRPLIELTKNNGERVISKHKRDEFRETKAPRPIIDPEKLKILQDAELVSQEWATMERLNHITSKIENCNMEHTGQIIKSMVEDIKREGDKEIVWSKDVEKAIGKATVLLFKKNFKNNICKLPD